MRRAAAAGRPGAYGRRTLLAVLLLGVAPAVVWAAYDYVRAADAWRRVEAAATAHERVSYRGTIGSRRAVEVVHDATSGRTRYAWGGRRKRAKVRDGLSSRGKDPAGFCLDLEALRRSYTARLGAKTRFLGREARVVHLRGRHPGRPGLRIVVDDTTALPLEVATYRADGSRYRVAAFRALEIGPQEVAPRGRRRRSWSTPLPADAVERVAGFAPYEPAYLPAGFRLKECRLVRWGRPTVSWVYTDGATAFELSQSPVTTPLAMEEALAERQGRERARRTVRRWLTWRMRRLAHTSDGDAAVARRSRSGHHRRYELRVGRVDVRLCSRDDLAPEETARVLRSLRRS